MDIRSSTPLLDSLTRAAGATSTGSGEYQGFPERNVTPTTRHIARPDYASLPESLITPAVMSRHGWQAAAWLVQSPQPLSAAQRAAVQDLAAAFGLTVETRREQASPAGTQAAAIGIGALLALAILGSTIGLIRSETARDTRTLAALGAPARIQRTLTGATAAALALTGAVLGVAAAYGLLVAIYQNDLGALRAVPIVPLAAIVAGVPLLATAAGWLLAGGLTKAQWQRAG